VLQPNSAEMKLIGSKKELAIRQELIDSNQRLQGGEYRSEIIAAIKSRGNLSDAYIINFVPEQAEDIYSILISIDEILIIEASRISAEVQLDSTSPRAYIADCSKINKLKTAIACDLIAQKSSF
jgi:hypothetical protein